MVTYYNPSDLPRSLIIRTVRGGMRVTGSDEDGEVRAVELTDRPFFVAALFQPELSALAGRTHPLIRAFVRAANVARAGL